MTTTDVTAPAAGALDLLLIRLLATSKVPPTPKAVRGLLARLLPEPFGAEAFDELVRTAKADGLLASRGLRLTDTGRARALAALGAGELPAKAPWKTIESRFLAPRAAGLRVPKPGEKAPSQDQLTARALADELGLRIPTGATLSQVFVAMLARTLDLTGETDLNRLVRRWLSRAAEADEELSMARLQEVLPRKLLDLPNGRPEGVRTKLIRGWIARRGDEPAEAPFDLAAFAATVRAAARDVTHGRYGETKVFINHLHRYLRDEPSFPPLDLETFKVRLVEANAAGLLELARADLVQDMDASDVRDSEISRLTGRFHFVTVN
jgi:hypothetical protein